MNFFSSLFFIALFLNSCTDSPSVPAEIATFDVEAEFNKGLKEANTGNDSLAIISFNLVIAHDSSDWNYYMSRAQTFQRLGEMDEALADFTKSIELSELNNIYLKSMFENRADIYFGKKMYLECFVDLNKAIEIDPDTSTTNTAIAMKSFYETILKSKDGNEYDKVMGELKVYEEQN